MSEDGKLGLFGWGLRAVAKVRQHGVSGLVWAILRRLGWLRPASRYASWRQGYEKEDLQSECGAAGGGEESGALLVSIVQVPGRVSKPRQQRQLLASLQRQVYSRWEFVTVVSAAAGDGEKKDTRLRVLPQVEEESAAQQLARCLEAARGELVVFLAHDAVLPPWAVGTLARAFKLRPEVDLIYSDADLLRSGWRMQPWFKPDWSPEGMLSVNLFDPLVAVRKSLLTRLAAGDLERDELALHWELSLRLAEVTQHPVHVPKILAHVRVGSWKAAKERGWRRPSPASAAAAAPAVAAHLQRAGLEATVTTDARGRLRVYWPVRGEPLVSLLVPTRDNAAVVKRCVESILERTNWPRFELLLLDNGSQEADACAFLRAIASHPKVRVLPWNFRFNWSAINNFGAQQAAGELLAFLNNDLEVSTSEWLEELVRWGQQPDVGVVGTLLVRGDGSVQHAGVAIGLGGVAGHPWEHMGEEEDSVAGTAFAYRNVMAVTGACQVVRREVFAELGGFDESFVTLFSDVEFCLRAWRRGYRIVHTPWARLVHYHGTTRGGDARMPPHDFWVAQERFGDVIAQGDPFLGPNLSPWSSVPQPKHPAEPRPETWLRHLVELSRQQYSVEEARHPQPIRPLVEGAHMRCRKREAS